jgi:hypothetical protein
LGAGEAAEALGVLVEVPRVGVELAEAGNNILRSAVRRGGPHSRVREREP